MPSVSSIAADLEITGDDTQRYYVKCNGFAKYRCRKGCKFTSQLGCIQLNCKKFFVKKYYVQKCRKHETECKPWLDPDLLEKMIENGLLRALNRPTRHFTGRADRRDRPPHIPHLCEACNYSDEILH